MHLPPTCHKGDRSARPLEIEGPMDEAAGIEHADQDGQAIRDIQADCGNRGRS
jgi:hypothetical protein